MKEYTAEELAQENGENGRRALVAVDGKVYDVTHSKLWRNGVHMKRHKSGVDLTPEMSAAPHKGDVFKNIPVVGVFDSCPSKLNQTDTEGIKGKIEQWLCEHPFYRRHPHPAAVHLPIGIVFAVIVFEILALSFQSTTFETAAFFCLILTVVTVVPSAMTGYFAWWVNYNAAKSNILNRKRCGSWFVLLTGIVAILMRAYFVENPVVINSLTTWIYLLSLLIFTSVIMYLGVLGGNLTFPYESPRGKK